MFFSLYLIITQFFPTFSPPFLQIFSKISPTFLQNFFNISPKFRQHSNPQPMSFQPLQVTRQRGWSSPALRPASAPSARPVWPKVRQHQWTGWWFGPFFMFPHSWEDDPIWLIFFRGLKPPTRWKVLKHQNCCGLCWSTTSINNDLTVIDRST